MNINIEWYDIYTCCIGIADIHYIRNLLSNFEVDACNVYDYICDYPLRDIDANLIINTIFDVIIEKENLDEDECDRYVNCIDSHFSYNDEEVHDIQELREIIELKKEE